MTIHSAVIQKLLSTNAHLSRRNVTHHFKIYTYGSRNAMSIIDSDRTLICLRNACDFIGNLVRQKGRFLFVNTNPLFDEIVEQMTTRIGCGKDTSWKLGGFLTNSSSPKKFRSRNKKLHLGAIQPPDCIVIMDSERKSSVIHEASRLQIPIVGLVDSSMPLETFKDITYPIPANDSVEFVYLFCNLITKTFLLEQKKLAAAMGSSAIKTETGDELQQKLGSSKNVVSVIPYESLAQTSDDTLDTKELLNKLAVVKIISGFGKAMGVNDPKSCMEVTDGVTYLDLVVNQLENINSKHGCNIPLILMNTLQIQDTMMKVVEKHDKKSVDIQTMFQNQKYSARRADDDDDEGYHLEDREVFLSLKTSGTLDALLSQGKEYILVLRSDNLASVLDPKIINHVIENRIQCCLEVTPNVHYDSSEKSTSQEEKVQLSEIADLPSKESMEKYKLIDTRSLWLNLKSLKKIVDSGILTEKHAGDNERLADGTRLSSTIKLFDRVLAINVPQSRFLPLTETSDLLLVQSDLYTHSEGILVRNTDRKNPANPHIVLGPEFKKLDDFQSRFKSIPSIIELDSLRVMGDVWFGADIILKGKVIIVARPGMRLEIPDGTVLQNKVIRELKDIQEES
ncbi:UTP--glucose-1-phosphate uridylyltransferase-like isoform X2 [Impatiens glandulifera]|uniref:UTP--glucose-1-phosphate uridylyltransferase-like isoform X2 n=1 Tax=Impatiens glandulifera TaxID=253017 RepID=UPI001FB0BCA1|nr:UTP--glucose-1-phosphate uridylyltransferase-like isoform X2 [Impatiens glandulifera]